MANPSAPVSQADYRAGTITGQTWRRANQIWIRNPLGGPATIAIDEEQVTQIGTSTTAKPTDLLHAVVDFTVPIALFDPATGAATGASMSQADVYVALYSLYRALAAARDAAQGVV